jgi:hypothetical protein
MRNSSVASPATTAAATSAGGSTPSRRAVEAALSPTVAVAKPVMAVPTAWGHRHDTRMPASP